MCFTNLYNKGGKIMEKETQIVTVNGVEMVVVYSKTRKGKPHPTGGVYKFLIPLSEYKPRQ